MSSVDMTHIKLSNGVSMPTIGFGCSFGTWSDADGFVGFLPEQAHAPLRAALDAGYEHFDTAHFYRSQIPLGRQLASAFEAGLKREDIFLTTKVAHSPPDTVANVDPYRTIDILAGDHSATGPLTPDEEEKVSTQVRQHYMQALDEVGVGYFDLLLMHWPSPHAAPDTPSNRMRARRGRLVVWNVFCEFLATGRAKAIGVSNFSERHLQELLDDIKASPKGEPPQWHPAVPGAVQPRKYPLVVPHVNQIEYHPHCQQTRIAELCLKHDIAVTAYSPLGSGRIGSLSDPTVVAVAAEVSKQAGEEVSAAQVLLLWLLQKGFCVIPRSMNPARGAANLRVCKPFYSQKGDAAKGAGRVFGGAARAHPPLGVRLTVEQMGQLDAIGKGECKRVCPSPDELI